MVQLPTQPDIATQPRSEACAARSLVAPANQLLFDDTDNQGRIQLKSSHAASELNLGHLIHAADNYRGARRRGLADL
jgi:hypothetical protein